MHQSAHATLGSPGFAFNAAAQQMQMPATSHFAEFPNSDQLGVNMEATDDGAASFRLHASSVCFQFCQEIPIFLSVCCFSFIIFGLQKF